MVCKTEAVAAVHGRIGKESGAGKMSVYGSGSGSGESGRGADMAAKLIIGLLLM